MATAKKTTKRKKSKSVARDAHGNAVPLQSSVEEKGFSDPKDIAQRHGPAGRGSMGEEHKAPPKAARKSKRR